MVGKGSRYPTLTAKRAVRMGHPAGAGRRRGRRRYSRPGGRRYDQEAGDAIAGDAIGRLVMRLPTMRLPAVRSGGWRCDCSR